MNYDILSDTEANELEGEINKEVYVVLKNVKRDKSPALMDILQNFSKKFWQHLGEFITRSINTGYKFGEMSVTQKFGVITCLTKPNK